MADIVCYNSDGSILEYYMQWSIDQELVIMGADLSVEPVVHLSNVQYKNALKVESDIVDNSIVIPIPDVLLQDPYPIIVNVDYVISVGTNFTVRIPVMPRARPNDYIYEDPENPYEPPIMIANNLTTNSADAALAAAQGVVLKEMIDNIDFDVDVTDEIEAALEKAKSSGEFDGRGIVSVLRTDGNGAAGTTDTYTITYTDNTETIFTIYNGANGTSGDPGSGETGEDGATFIPYVDADGNLSWSNNKGLANPDTVNIKGEDGYTPVKGVDYVDGKDGYTPVKGVDYEDGKDGKDGVSPVVVTTETDSGVTISVENGDGTTSSATIMHGLNGGDGVSCTHSWNGTALSVTSASGTSSANLVGPTGDDGVSVISVEQTVSSEEDDGINVITVTLSNGQTFSFNIKNGSKGSTGNVGSNGSDGSDATINGVNALTLNTGAGLSVSQTGSTMTISSTYQYSTTDLTAGESALTTGTLYFVYE